MKPYESWDFCKSINCNALIRPKELRKQTICTECTAYKMHQYLKENGQILEKGSELLQELEALRALEKVAIDIAKYEHTNLPKLKKALAAVKGAD